MLSHLLAYDPFENLQHDISRADAATPDLAATVLDLVLARRRLPGGGDPAKRIRRLIDAQAWTDAALALVALDRSRVLRHAIHEDGEWRCTLGSPWPLPACVDDTIEFAHADLPLAIFGALVGALQEKFLPASAAALVSRARAEPRDAVAYVNCDNFA